MDWFLNDRDLRHEEVKEESHISAVVQMTLNKVKLKKQNIQNKISTILSQRNFTVLRNETYLLKLDKCIKDFEYKLFEHYQFKEIHKYLKIKNCYSTAQQPMCNSMNSTLLPMLLAFK